MPIYIKHNDSWLKLKRLHTVTSKHGRKSAKKKTSFYTIIAESHDSVKYNGYRYKTSLTVHFSKVMRFAIRAFKEIDQGGYDVIILISSDNDNYRADVYAKRKKELVDVVNRLERILNELRSRHRYEESEEEEEEEEE